MSPIHIRPYTPADRDATLAVFRDAVRVGARRDYTAAQVLAWAPDDIDPDAWGARRASRPTWVAEHDGAVIGFTDLEPDGHVDMLFVATAWHGQGVAGALYRAVEQAARAQGLTRLYTEASLLARAVFAHYGFRVIAAQTVERRGQHLSNFRMEKLLP